MPFTYADPSAENLDNPDVDMNNLAPDQDVVIGFPFSDEAFDADIPAGSTCYVASLGTGLIVKQLNDNPYYQPHIFQRGPVQQIRWMQIADIPAGQAAELSGTFTVLNAPGTSNIVCNIVNIDLTKLADSDPFNNFTEEEYTIAPTD